MNLRLLRSVAALLACLPVIVVVGCGGGDAGSARYHVSGTVTHKGQPVPRGTILFQPDGSKGNSGPATNADSVDGLYDTARQGTGTVGGPHIVVIQGFDGNAKPEEELLLGMPLFTEYRTTADMPNTPKAGTVDFQVSE
ncbi:MAG: hypothetical protein HYV60_19890 [Planctomycetia bacterium]|nr:hypothetical protein [Planctomycetia bacterium]